MTGLEVGAIITAMVVLGSLILERLPKSTRHKDFRFELCDGCVTLRIDNLLEDKFKVAFTDDWETGRGFSLWGTVIRSEDNEQPEDPPFGKRAGVQIGPTANWFQSSRIGGIRVYQSGGSECFVALPFQIARHVLEEVRRDPDQLVTLGFKRVSGKDGRPAFPIYTFELSKPLD